MTLPLPIWFAPSHDNDASPRHTGDRVRVVGANASREARDRIFDTNDEAHLVTRVRAGDADAFGIIVRATAPRLVSFAYGFTRRQDIAEDLVQDVFLAIWERREEWAPESVIAYLLRAVRNRAFKANRRAGVEQRHRDAVACESFVTGDATDAAVEAEQDAREWVVRITALRAEIDQLTERQRSAYLLRYEQGLTIPQIAHVLGVTPKGAEQLVRRTTHFLRDRLRAQIPE